MMNKVFLVGRITKDPELRTNVNGHPYVFFTVAINRLPSPSGERVADFISCVAWNRQAENLARFIRKGGLIGVDGKLQTRTTTNPDGTNRQVMEVVCDNISFLESKNVNEQPVQNPGYDDYYSGGANYNRQAPSYNNTNYNNYQQSRPMNNPMPKQEEPAKNPFADEVKGQFDITDDDLPF